MLCFRLFGTLLLTALLASVVHTERVTTCEDTINVQRLSCDVGVISIGSALYGRTNSKTCSEGRPLSQLTNTDCSLDGTTNLLKRSCNGKKVCEINTGLVHVSDPCYGTYKYLDTNYTCLPAYHTIACEHSLAYLYCDEGKVISVYGAEYGRRDTTTCSYKRPASQVTNVSCFNSKTIEVGEMCDGKNNCTLNARNQVFGDPCGGTYKYLEVAYVCDYAECDTDEEDYL